ncbi:MAG: hypothetical protein ABFS38_17035 [Bacteroidota bacterium]
MRSIKSILLLLFIFHVSIRFVVGQEADKGKKIDNEYLILRKEVLNDKKTVFEVVKINGIPFIQQPLWQPNDEKDQIVPAKHGEEVDVYLRSTMGNLWIEKRFEDLDIHAGEMYIFGAINSLDKAHPPWGGGNSYRNFFIGDSAGILTLTYVSGLQDTIPLIFGYNVGWNHHYKISSEPFKSDPEAKKELDQALCVANALEGYNSRGDDYYIRIDLRDEKLESAAIYDHPKKIGYFRLDGITFGAVKETGNLQIYRAEEGEAIPESTKQWMKSHTIHSDNPLPQSRVDAINILRERYYTSGADINYTTIARAAESLSPGDFPGPKVKFEGTPVARLMTNIYYENTTDLLERIGEDGMVHESAYKADRFDGFAGWTPDLGAYYTTSYTRLRGLTVLTQLGFEEEVNRSIDYFDKWLMYFPQAYPDLQLGGKPVPGHATVIANQPHIYFDLLKGYGWPTKYTTRDFGNPENDGHGLLMLTRWRAWSKQGKEQAWIENRWEAIHEAAEYIPWCLDNPELSFSEQGLLHNESEGGLNKLSMYCDFACHLGLKSYSEMAESIENSEKAGRWSAEADRLYQNMTAYYPKETDQWGDVWDPEKNAAFGYTHSTLAPLCIGMDYWGYDVVNKLSQEWAGRTRRTYNMQLEKNAPEGAASAGIGYGQGYITQSALLLDEMKDVQKMVEWMAKVCFAPGLQHPFRVPEGSIISADGSTWRRWGDLGNLYQLVEVVHTINLIAGIDDFSSGQLTIMPRLPLDWKNMKIDEWPVRVISGGESVLEKMSMKLSSDYDKGNQKVTLTFEKPVDQGDYRLGPFPAGAESIKVTRNGKKVKASLFRSGTESWAWIDISGERQIVIEATVK